MNEQLEAWACLNVIVERGSKGFAVFIGLYTGLGLHPPSMQSMSG